MMRSNHDLGLGNTNVYTKFSKIISIFSQDIVRKRKHDGRTDEQMGGRNEGQPKSSIAPLLQKRGCKVVKKPVIGVSEKARLKPVSSATETS